MLGIKSFSWTDLQPEIEVGNYSSIAKNCRFLIGTYNHYCIKNRKFVSTFSFKMDDTKTYPKVGHDVWIGENVLVCPKVKIGDGAIVAAGSVIVKDVPPYALVAGNPAVVKKYRFPKKTIEKLLKIKWWNWSEQQINERLSEFEDVEAFVTKYA